MTHGCRFCGAALTHSFCDLGLSPLSNAFLAPERLQETERFYPLRAFVCDRCFLVQLEQYESPQAIFSDYAYFSSYSETWLRHAERYVVAMIDRLGIGPSSRVVEIASNDGYLLQYFVRRGVQVLGVEPAANVAAAAVARGVPTLVRFFGAECARELVASGRSADLIVANNVLAHVPDLNDFVGGLRILLAPGGTGTCEFPHLLRLMQGNQFDTIYHEHLYYFSLGVVQRILAAHQLELFDVEQLPTHGGSLRVFARHAGAASGQSAAVRKVLEDECAAGLDRVESYGAFQAQVGETKRALLQFLSEARRDGKRIAAYGAAAKGNTLLNFCGIRGDSIEYVADRSPHKQGRYLPGTRLPVVHPDRIRETRPDYVLILPWNLQEEVMAQLAYVREWRGRFVVPIPSVRVLA